MTGKVKIESEDADLLHSFYHFYKIIITRIHSGESSQTSADAAATATSLFLKYSNALQNI